MVYTIEEVQKMLKLWGAYREFDEGESIHLGCGSPTYAAMLHAKGHIRQSENCRTVFTPPPAPDYYILIGQAIDNLRNCASLQYLVGSVVQNSEVKIYTQARLLVKVLRLKYCYGMGLRRIGVHVGKILKSNGKRSSDDKVESLLSEAHQYICNYLNQRLKICEIAPKAIDKIG